MAKKEKDPVDLDPRLNQNPGAFRMYQKVNIYVPMRIEIRLQKRTS